MPDCFIIMPISTPELWLPEYSGDLEHFEHVLDHLFIPSLKQAGYNPISPVVKGAEVIHASIIKNIEKADLVLCDMSTLNPNVFFEFGIRTAVNKPVCIVKDEKTDRVPFDTGILHYHDYFSELRPWNQGDQIEKLVAHIKESSKGSEGRNPLWKQFGFSTRAELVEGTASTDDKIGMLSLKLDDLARTLRRERRTPETAEEILDMVAQQRQVAKDIGRTASKNGIDVISCSFKPPNIIQLIVPQMPLKKEALLGVVWVNFGG